MTADAEAPVWTVSLPADARARSHVTGDSFQTECREKAASWALNMK